MIDEQDRDCRNHGRDRNGHEVLFQRQSHAYQGADHDGGEDGAAAANAGRPADAG